MFFLIHHLAPIFISHSGCPAGHTFYICFRFVFHFWSPNMYALDRMFFFLQNFHFSQTNLLIPFWMFWAACFVSRLVPLARMLFNLSPLVTHFGCSKGILSHIYFAFCSPFTSHAKCFGPHAFTFNCPFIVHMFCGSHVFVIHPPSTTTFPNTSQNFQHLLVIHPSFFFQKKHKNAI